ncbi:glycosyl transferase, group 1 family protein [Photobacterium sp. SKA34]|uniref:glycosyltransferase family 4 protein n=1 Tax=Photobacterium sp. SKA34 TaxID=121723 RepID=UPI00006ACD32|nr:glycosyltransferase family 4 protein [Photobacterium sp. SKA34]EAR56471.1 glycosyl transferase, group 1 family protein [Photobacterium sp. SKA34]
MEYSNVPILVRETTIMKLLYIVNVDWFFISHRLPIALTLIKNGYEVHIACGITDRKNELESLGIIVHPLSITRSGTSFFKEVKVIKEINTVVNEISPDVVHLVTIKGAIYGGLVTRNKNIKKRIVSISGLGFVFIDEGIKARLIRFIVTKLYRLALNTQNTKIIFQNETDKNTFIENKIINYKQCVLIKGSGIDLNVYKYIPEPQGEKVVMFLARLLKDKGLIEFCEAAVILRKSGFTGRFVLVGDIDLDNPNSISQVELNNYIDSGVVEHWGFLRNIPDVISKANIMVLPSYREGLPKSLIEAAACGRAVITTDVPGCRDAIIPNVTGVLVPAKSSEELQNAILSLCNDDKMRIKMGKEGRKLSELSFDIKDVINTHMNLYKGNI